VTDEQAGYSLVACVLSVGFRFILPRREFARAKIGGDAIRGVVELKQKPF
jgi:hypothetical protein